MDVFDNRNRLAEGSRTEPDGVLASIDAATVLDLLSRCPRYEKTPLRDEPALAKAIGIQNVFLKDERGRMGLGSFKALGGAYAIAMEACARGTLDVMTALLGETFVCASAGNHGISVTAGARHFGAGAVVYLCNSVPDHFADLMETLGATVVRHGETYQESMTAATAAADENGWILLADASWPGYEEWPRRVMQGYLIIAHEIVTAFASAAAPTHVFLQAGVGGMAASVAAYLRSAFGQALTVVIVEPDRAPCLLESARAGRPVSVVGAASNMGRLDCKRPSEIAIASLMRDADFFVSISDDMASKTTALLSQHGVRTTPSGAAGIAAACYQRGFGADLGIRSESKVLAILTE